MWTVRNAGGGGSGIRTLESATYNSTNTVYAQVSFATGPENIVEMAHRIGIESPLNPVLSIALGTQSVSPFEMASAYSTIANYGEKVEPYLIEKIEDADGNVVYEHEVDRNQVYDRAMGAAVVRTLQKVTTQGTATRANLPDRVEAGKTGTAQNFQDVWFMGFIPQYTTAVWSGYADAQIELVDFTVYNEPEGREQYYSRAFGGTLSAPIWKQFMTYITADLPVEDFPPEPDGTSSYFRVPLTEVPNVLNLSEKAAKDAIYKAGLFANIALTASAEPKGSILSQSPSGGTSISQGKTVTVRISSGIPPAVPNLIGLNLDEVGPAVSNYNSTAGTSLSWTIAGQPTENQTLWGVVIRTDPPGGAAVPGNGVITVFVGQPPGNGGGG